MVGKISSFAELDSILKNEGVDMTSGYVPEKDQKYCLVSTVAYLIGVRDRYFGENQNFDEKIYRQLSTSKNARIVRNLCLIRNSFEVFFGKISGEVHNGRDALGLEYIPQDAVMTLNNDGIKLTRKSGVMPLNYIIEINQIISDRINNCRNLLPDWISWEYVKEIFIMPEGLTQDGAKAAGAIFKENYNCYPFHTYMNWPVPHEDGNILLNDKKFAQLLYLSHYDEFSDFNKVIDVSSQIKGNIYDFLEAGSKISMIVDCENSDVYNMIAMLRNLEWEQLQKIAKIILVNDVNTNLGWQELEKCTDISIEHIMTKRVMDGKSLVDGQVIAKAFTEYYEANTDSFVLLSSDSDFWTLVDSLKSKARFLVMVEHMKCSPDYKERLADAGVMYCYLDDFNSGEESEQMKENIMLRAVDQELQERQFSMIEIFEKVLENYRISMDDVQKKQFFRKNLKNLQATVSEDGTVMIHRGNQR